LLEDTIEGGRFPRRHRFLDAHPGLEPVIDALLAHRRGKFLVEVPLRGAKNWQRRLAVTVPAVRSLDDAVGRREAKALDRTHETLCAALRAGVFDDGSVSMEELHDWSRSTMTLADFGRRVTMLASPRLSGLCPDDPMGYCGLAAGAGAPDPSTGYFDVLVLFPNFEGAPFRGKCTTRPLLPAPRLRAEIEGGVVIILAGTRRLATLPDHLGARAVAVLLRYPRVPIHLYDLQSMAFGLSELPASADEARVAAWNAPPRLPRTHRDRLGALDRRIRLLESLPASTTRPTWAASPHVTAATLRGELERQLALGSLPGEFPGIQNLGRIMRRAIRKVLADAGLTELLKRLKLGEWNVYTPRD
jgi:hypothetical protein